MAQMTEEEKKKHKEFLEKMKELRNRNSRKVEPEYKNKSGEDSKKEKTNKGKGGPSSYFKKTVG